MRDRDIRQALVAELRRAFRDDADTLIVEELGLCQGQARVDVAVVNGALHGFEIKSDQDTLERLPGQVEIYNRALDTISLVFSGRSASDLEKVIPSWWGMLEAKSGPVVHLEELRPALRNPLTDAYAIAQLLWRDEALEVLSQLGLQAGCGSKPRNYLWAKLAANLALDDLRDRVRETLRERVDWRPA
jgi:hypothetical protein